MSNKTQHCDVCGDNRGFTARPCPGCGRQRPIDHYTKRVYNRPVGSFLEETSPRPAPAAALVSHGVRIPDAFVAAVLRHLDPGLQPIVWTLVWRGFVGGRGLAFAGVRELARLLRIPAESALYGLLDLVKLGVLHGIAGERWSGWSVDLDWQAPEAEAGATNATEGER